MDPLLCETDTTIENYLKKIEVVSTYMEWQST